MWTSHAEKMNSWINPCSITQSSNLIFGWLVTWCHYFLLCTYKAQRIDVGAILLNDIISVLVPWVGTVIALVTRNAVCLGRYFWKILIKTYWFKMTINWQLINSGNSCGKNLFQHTQKHISISKRTIFIIFFLLLEVKGIESYMKHPQEVSRSEFHCLSIRLGHLLGMFPIWHLIIRLLKFFTMGVNRCLWFSIVRDRRLLE